MTSTSSDRSRMQTPIVPDEFIYDSDAHTSYEDHEALRCSPDVCTWHAAEDIFRAEQIKAATRRLDYSSVATE